MASFRGGNALPKARNSVFCLESLNLGCSGKLQRDGEVGRVTWFLVAGVESPVLSQGSSSRI